MDKDGYALCAIIPAAGESRRYGPENKLLSKFDGVAILERVVQAIGCTNINKIVVVTGSDHAEIASLLSGYPVECIQNPDWTAGMGTSIACGARELTEKAFDGVLICLGDLPELTGKTVQTVIEAFRENRATRIVLPIFGKRRGHPVILPISFLSELRRLSGDEGARSLIKRHGDQVVEIPVE
ncbi:MAG: nucleotidyltransferase family protein, partial [Verrucomicrobiae bacterium]|nr:nucleotidyltransferase family protein [Verrucomicrobiae bacterium]